MAKAEQKARWLRWGLYAIAVVALALAFALERTRTLSYNPVNGDFQSYNVFRRLLAGQRPVQDFANYIGLAPVVLNMPFMLLSSGSFAASLFITNFTCCVLFCLCALVVFWLVSGNTAFSMVASAALPKLVSSGLLSLLGGPGRYASNLFTQLYTPSNSMRIARIFWPFLLVFLFVLVEAIHRRRKGEALDLAAAPQRLPFCALLGGLAGLGVAWSNDFGLAAAFSSTLLLALLLAFGRRGAPKAQNQTGKTGPWAAIGWFAARAGAYLGCLLLGGLLSATIAGGGNPAAWLAATAATGQYQYFYFNGTGGRALLPYVFTNLRLLFYTAGYLAFLGWCLWRLIRGKLSNRALLAGFLALCILVASYAYILSGSGYNFTEALEGFFWLGAMALAAKGLLWLARRRQRPLALGLTAVVLVLALVFPYLAVREYGAGQAAATETAGTLYQPALGGQAPYPLALGEAAILTEGEAVFSVYATGLEVVKGQFQPSGYDYIIHALGDDARAAYLADFEAGGYTWAQTVSFDLERWLCVENWDFYRLVAAGYRREYKTEYSWLWRRADADLHLDTAGLGASLAVQPREDGSVQLVVSADADTPPFTADVKVVYDTGFKSAGSALLSLGRRCVVATVPDPVMGEASAGAYFAAESDGLYLPIRVENGTGTATLTPRDSRHVQLTVASAELVGALPDLWAPAVG